MVQINIHYVLSYSMLSVFKKEKKKECKRFEWFCLHRFTHNLNSSANLSELTTHFAFDIFLNKKNNENNKLNLNFFGQTKIDSEFYLIAIDSNTKF